MVCDWSQFESNSRKFPIPLIADSWAVMNYQFLYLLCKRNLNREKKIIFLMLYREKMGCASQIYFSKLGVGQSILQPYF